MTKQLRHGHFFHLVQTMKAPEELPRIVIVDHYDSYTRNLIPLIAKCFEHAPSADLLASRVTVIPQSFPALMPDAFVSKLLPHVDALILSPGPGMPDNDVDFGTSKRLLQAPALQDLPILGVCLGHQGIAASEGAKTTKLTEPFHGRTRKLEMSMSEPRADGSRCIMSGVPEGTDVICYNSLCVDEATVPDKIRVVARSPLGPGASMVQALEHKERPLYGVQFHPESIETCGGEIVMRNFLHNVARFWTAKDPARVASWKNGATCLPQDIIELGHACLALGTRIDVPGRRWRVCAQELKSASSLQDKLTHESAALFEMLFRQGDNPGAVWLDSANARDPQSHMSAQSRASFVLTYDMSGVLRTHANGTTNQVPLTPYTSLWDWMEIAERTLSAQTEPLPPNTHTHFRTGFVGYWGYELKDESLALEPLSTLRYEPHDGAPFDRTKLPAAQWAFCDHVLCLDHASNTWVAYALVDDGGAAAGPLASLEKCGVQLGMSAAEAQAWFRRAQSAVDTMSRASTNVERPSLSVHAVDDADTYKARIEKCKEFIASGESYELCLTTQFEGRMPSLSSYSSYFALYCALRRKNPAPFSAYMELLSMDGTPQAILSTSPERFLTVTDSGAVEMRPIKGTKVRPGWGAGEQEWLERAKEDASVRAEMDAEDERRKQMLHMDPKERAENLMIADLIRADLQSVCYPDSVEVPRLIALETYETVHQLVTSVTGQLRPGIGCVEAAKRCFPPGSMTGAPKRRSVELLETLERTDGAPAGTTRRRGVYSGALGFMGVDGASNLSVVIRTVTVQNSSVLVGAGGAITILSTAEGEWDEVMTKLGSVASLAA